MDEFFGSKRHAMVGYGCATNMAKILESHADLSIEPRTCQNTPHEAQPRASGKQGDSHRNKELH